MTEQKTKRGGADRGQGRKSLTGGKGRSPILQVSMPPTLRRRVAAHAARLGISDSDLGRLAVANHINDLENSMIIVQIANDVPDDAFERVRALLDDVTLRHTDFGGVEYILERADYTCIENKAAGVTEEDSCTLFSWVQSAIRGEMEG